MLQHNDLFPSPPCADSPLKADVEHDRVSDLLTVAEVALARSKHYLVVGRMHDYLVVWSYHIIPLPVIYYILTTAGVPSWEGMAAVGSVYPRNILHSILQLDASLQVSISFFRPSPRLDYYEIHFQNQLRE